MPEQLQSQGARPGLSGIITCFNEEDNIAACIESLDWCDEILVVDSFSTDRTPEIAKSHPKVRFVQRRYFGGASQKNWAIDRSAHEWILILDADERCTPELRREIEGLLRSGPSHDAYTIARRVFFLGRVIRYSGWQHDRVIRLIRRGHGYYRKRRVHEPLLASGPAPLLRNPMEHFMVDSLHEYVERLTRYGYWGAAQCWIDGKRSGASKILVRTLWRFLRTYLVQFGFLDGARGVVFCLIQSYGTYVKWALLWNWQQDAILGRQPSLPDFDDDDEVWRGLHRLEAGLPVEARSRPGLVTAESRPAVAPVAGASRSVEAEPAAAHGSDSRLS